MLLMLELVKADKHFYLLNSTFQLKAAGNTEKDKGDGNSKLGAAEIKT